jgi:hypothetical protein
MSTQSIEERTGRVEASKIFEKCRGGPFETDCGKDKMPWSISDRGGSRPVEYLRIGYSSRDIERMSFHAAVMAK